MATKRVVTETVEEGPEDAEYIEVIEGEDDEDQQLDALEGMISEFSGAADAVVNVYRQGEGKNMSFLFRTNPGEMTGGEIMEKCRDRFGTGDYRVHIRKGPRLVANKPFSVEAEKEDEKDDAKKDGLDTLAFITMLQENNKQTMLMFTEAMKAFAGSQNNTPVFDPVAAQASLMQQLASLKQMSEPKDQSKDAVNMLIQGLTLAKELGPKDGETNSSDILLEGIKQFAPALVQGAQAMKEHAPGNGAQLPPPDQQAAADAAREKEMGMRQMVIRQQLGFLVQNAANGKNPELYAELLLDQLGEKVVLDFIAQPDALEKLVAINADVATHSQWFEALRNSILELTADTGDTDPIVTGDVIIPGADPNAVNDAVEPGDATGDSTGGGGDAGNA
jgi:hypothetical protein